MQQELLDNWFTYHSPTPDQLPKYAAIREAAKKFAEVINENCPESADKTYAVRLIRMAAMTGNASLACGGK